MDSSGKPKQHDGKVAVACRIHCLLMHEVQVILEHEYRQLRILHATMQLYVL